MDEVVVVSLSKEAIEDMKKQTAKEDNNNNEDEEVGNNKQEEESTARREQPFAADDNDNNDEDDEEKKDKVENDNIFPTEPADNDKDEEDEEQLPPEMMEQQRGCCYHCMKRVYLAWIIRVLDQWPRLSSIVFGLAVPLWGLIILAWIFGIALAALEAPDEIANNDFAMAANTRLDSISEILSSLMGKLTLYCLWQLQHNNSSNGTTAVGNIITEDIMDVVNPLLEQALHPQGDVSVQANAFEELIQMKEQVEKQVLQDLDAAPSANIEDVRNCSQTSSHITEALIKGLAVAFQNAGDLTFNWNRCTANILFRAKRQWQHRFVPEHQRAAQRAYYGLVWQADRLRLYNQYLQEPNMSETEALLRATNDATGADACGKNVGAATWFFFTVMTTVGYGNQAPVTSGGKTLIFTVGFLSLIAFGAVLARSGHIVNLLVDDFFNRIRLPFLKRPWIGLFIWGTFAYVWMIFIAFYYKDWRSTRLNEEISLGTGYWFAYISTTTIGLGDWYLEPEVITDQDLLLFPLIILVGFVFFSAFLGKLAGFVTKDPSETIYSQSLEQRLKNTEWLRCRPMDTIAAIKGGKYD